MAAGNITVLNIALEKILQGTFDLSSVPFVLVLTTKDQPLTAAFVGASGQALYSDLTDETSGAGYTAGGQAMAGVDVSLTGAVAKVTADPVTWESATLTAKYGVICMAEASGDPTDILAFFDMETTSADGRASDGGDLIVNFAAGLFDLQRA